MTEKTRPTKKQREMLVFIENFISGHGYGPSYREIQKGLGYGSVSTVANHIDNLIVRGHLVKRTNSARSLELVGSSADDFETSKAKKNDEKWLVDQVTLRFKEVEGAKKKDSHAIDELYVLVGALKVLGFEDAARAFAHRLSDINKSKTN